MVTKQRTTLGSLIYEINLFNGHLTKLSNIVEEDSIMEDYDFVEWIHQDQMDIDTLWYACYELIGVSSPLNGGSENSSLSKEELLAFDWSNRFMLALDRAIENCSSLECKYVGESGYENFGEYMLYIKNSVFPSIANCVKTMAKYI